MKIAIDLSQIIYGTGVSNYRENLVKNLLSIDSQNEYILFGGSFRRYNELKFKISSMGDGKVFPIPPRFADLIWNKLHILPVEKLIGGIDVLHTSDWAEMPSRAFKVTTIHDLIPLLFPRLTPKIIVNTHKDRLEWVKKESDRIIVPSIATKLDLIKYGFDEKKIRVIYEAPNFSKATAVQIDQVKKKYGIHEDYIIAIGTNPRKNIQQMVDAYHLSKYGKNLKMLVVGENKGLKIKDERGVRFLGHVNSDDLCALLTGSKVLVFASLYEGFGIPILEAYNCEVPVVTSNLSSMPESAGGAAVLVDPHDVNSIASGIEEALNKSKSLIASGLKQVAKFSWEKTAHETLGVYEESNIK